MSESKNHMQKERRKRNLFLVLFGLISASLIFCVMVFGQEILPDLLWVHEPFHSAVEAFGSFIALLMAVILLSRRRQEVSSKYHFIALGFLAMGILDGFHSLTNPGQSFVFLRSLASLLGGIFFMFTWFPPRKKIKGPRLTIPLAVIVVTGGISIFSLLNPDRLPLMVNSKGAFTPLAVQMNYLAGVLFCLAAVRFLLDFYQAGKMDFFLLAVLSALFGFAELTFETSAIWDMQWWLWHLMRLAAYGIVLFFVGMEFRENIKYEKRAREAIAQAKAYSDLLFQVVPSAIFAVDRNRNITAWNKKAEEITGYSIEEVIGKECVLFAEQPCKEKCGLLDPDMQKPIIGRECTIRHKDGSTRFISKNADIILGENGIVLGGIESFEDTTGRKQFEEQLKNHAQELERMNKMMVGRELRMVELKKEIKTLKGRLP